jgi:hypothetical protein
MTFVIILHIFLTVMSWRIADRFEPWSFGYNANIFASALNGALVVHFITKSTA